MGLKCKKFGFADDGDQGIEVCCHHHANSDIDNLDDGDAPQGAALTLQDAIAIT